MSDTTPRLGLPYIAASQAQKHVTHNEALVLLDALSGIIQVLDRDLTSPPGDPTDGDIYILGGAGSDDWSGYDAGDLAFGLDGEWRRIQPSTGMIAALADESGSLVYWTGSAWSAVELSLSNANLVALAGLTFAAGQFIALTGAGAAAARAIVGTVSQSGSVPTGAVIEYGSNANGSYVRLADGTQLCWCTVTISSFAWSGAAPLYYQNNTGGWSWPAAFAAVPVAWAQSTDSAIGTRSARIAYMVLTTTALSSFYFIAPGNGTSGFVASQILVIGRWY